MKIRIAHINDAEVISELAKTTFDETFRHLFADRNILLTYFERTFSLEKILGSIQKENNVFWLAIAGNKPVVYAKLKIHSLSEFVKGNNVS